MPRRIHYLYSVLQPQPGLRLTLRSEQQKERDVEVSASFKTSSKNMYLLHQGVNAWRRDAERELHFMRARYFEKGDKLLVVKIPEFAFSALEVDKVIDKMRKHQGVVLDLRGNPGGFEDTLDRLLGGLFENDLKIYDRVGRNESKPVSANGRHRDAFTGRFNVLIDSDSASASELFARVIQLNKRGFVFGDRSAGSVMMAKYYRHELYVDSISFYGASITQADLLMTDGQSLEHVGVEPDIEILPTGNDLALGRDPVMAKAAALLGVQLTPEEAGAIFPYEDPAQP